AVRPEAEKLVLRIGDPRGPRPPPRVEQAHGSPWLDVAGLNVGERELGRARREALLAGGREGETEERHPRIIVAFRAAAASRRTRRRLFSALTDAVFGPPGLKVSRCRAHPLQRN